MLMLRGMLYGIHTYINYAFSENHTYINYAFSENHKRVLFNQQFGKLYALI